MTPGLPTAALGGARRLVDAHAPASLRRAAGERVALRRLAHRLGFVPANARPAPPPTPVGAKFELTYSCNLTCPFCYTDSPRRTRERATDLSDEAWLGIVDDAIATGIVEAVVTGGEPLLRRELALEVSTRLAAADIGVTLNTNGWFVDEAVADKLASNRGLQVNISIDGSSPLLHDSIRGVRGSWRRAVLGIDHLLRRGVRVCVAHVVTPDNERLVGDFLDEMLTLGVARIRMTPAAPIGAAARAGKWEVDRRELRRTVERFSARTGGSVDISLRPGTIAGIASLENVAPAALLVRPNGSVWVNSQEPFAFGNATEDTLRTCWERIRERWWDPEIQAWSESVRSVGQFVSSGSVPYLNPELQLVPTAAGPETASPDPRLPRARAVPGGEPEDLAGSRRFVRDLALGRAYVVAPVRSVEDADGGRFVRVLADGRMCRLNRTAARVMDVCRSGAPLDAVAELSREQGARDDLVPRHVLTTVRDLVDRGILVPST
jgi:Fe-coproporphyrin III synthase